jgi:hypothetical protein
VDRSFVRSTQIFFDENRNPDRQAPASGPNLLCLFEGKVPDVADRNLAQKSSPFALARMWGKKIPRADNGSFSKYHQLFLVSNQDSTFSELCGNKKIFFEIMKKKFRMLLQLMKKRC